jgi:siroheme synthase
VIEKGTTPDQRVLAGTLDDIADTVRGKDVTGPALTIIGDVAAFARDAEQPVAAPVLATAV